MKTIALSLLSAKSIAGSSYFNNLEFEGQNLPYYEPFYSNQYYSENTYDNGKNYWKQLKKHHKFPEHHGWTHHDFYYHPHPEHPTSFDGHLIMPSD